MKLYIYGTRHIDSAEPRHDDIVDAIDEPIDTIYSESAAPPLTARRFALLLLVTPLFIGPGILYVILLRVAAAIQGGDYALVDMLEETYVAEVVPVGRGLYDTISKRKFVLLLTNWSTVYFLGTLVLFGQIPLSDFPSLLFGFSSVIATLWIVGTADTRTQNMTSDIYNHAASDDTAVLITGAGHVDEFKQLLDMIGIDYDHINEGNMPSQNPFD